MEQISKKEIVPKISEGLQFKAKTLCIYSLFILLSGLLLCLFPGGVKVEIALLFILLPHML